ncbi:MAG TPA: SDR family oxidoreductase [Myxococcota bacterium]|nr:SDR family oxidoreductase [Myxococcota bacterium]
MPTKEFAGKTALITGGAQGIGAAYARLLAARGASVAIADIQGERASAVAKELAQGGTPALGLGCDVASPEACVAAVEATAQRFGGVDYLVNNAGLLSAAREKPLHAIEPERYLRVLAVMTHGMLWMAQAAASEMKKRGGGAIVNTSSIGSWQAAGVYGMSKHAVNYLTVTLAKELAPLNIRVNAIAPGSTETEGVREIMTREQLVAYQRASGGGTDRIAGAEDVARVGVYLLSDDARFVSGQIVAVDQATHTRL